jgi:LIM domain kinase 1
MKEARHPNVVQYLGLCLSPSCPPSSAQRILIISEYLPRGNLRSYIHHVHLPFPWRLRVSFVIDVTRGLAYLHARNCLHRDLKGENLLVTENERLKICDFGFARIAARNEEEMRRMSYCGTDGYMSPEILMGEEFGLPTDVFSLGVIFIEIVTRRLVDGDTFKRELPSFGISHAEIVESASPHCPPSFIALTLACISIDASSRPTVRSVLASLSVIEQEVLDMESRGIGLTPSDLARETGTWNVGSITRVEGSRRGGSKRSGPVMPSFDGVVGSSVLRTTQERQGSESDEDIDFAMLALAEVKIDGHQRGKGEGGSDEYSTDRIARGSTLASSTLTVRAFPDDHSGHARLVSSASSLPALPSSWIRYSDADESAPLHPSPQATESYMTARTSTLSFSGATINHGSQIHNDAGESDDVFHSTIRASSEYFEILPISTTTLNRFSLIKPGFQRFLSSFSPAAPSVVNLAKRASGEYATGSKGSVEDAGKRGGGLRCGLCEKKFGIMKPFLECDECRFR